MGRRSSGSRRRLLIVLWMVAYMAVAAVIFHAAFGARPHALFGG